MQKKWPQLSIATTGFDDEDAADEPKGDKHIGH
jgi:hypothetical protein